MPDTQARQMPRTLVLVGAGKMGGAMLEGWLLTGMRPTGITVIDPQPSPEITALQKTHGFALNPPMSQINLPEALVLAIKPQALDMVAPLISGLVQPAVVLISVLAGKTVANLKTRLPHAGAIVRAMPNLPASVRRGVTGAAPNDEVSDTQKAMADALLASVGQVEWVEDESLIDAVTAVSGSGPAYVFHLVEALAAAGAAVGLPPDTAMRLARATIEGAGEMLHRTDIPPGVLRHNVTSPGGTTAAALDVLMADNGLTPLMRRAVAAARQRAEELSG